MRKLAVTLCLWLCKRFSIRLVDETRLRMGDDAIARAMRWDAFYREEGGLADMIAALRREAFEAAAELDPRDTDKIYYWATADRNVRRLEQKVVAIIQTGRLAQQSREENERIIAARIVKSL